MLVAQARRRAIWVGAVDSRRRRTGSVAVTSEAGPASLAWGGFHCRHRHGSPNAPNAWRSPPAVSLEAGDAGEARRRLRGEGACLAHVVGEMDGRAGRPDP